MLAQNHPDDNTPILEETLAANFVSTHIIRAKPLHTEIIYETLLLKRVDVRTDPRNGYIIWNESKSD